MEDLYQKLLDASFHFVSFRPRSEKEMRAYLAKKLSRLSVIPARDARIQFPILDRVIARLRELDYVNDEKFAAWWVDQRQSHKPKGNRLILQELKAKGVAVEIKQPDEVGLARQALAKKLERWQTLPKIEQKKKIYGFLGRRGFDADTIRRVIDEVVGGRVQ
ncbi:MAG: regulatory protein RecX [Candidatus Gottesmanbacteria bacterium]|nr:regulatory protein RecX [Candidatus Gottesmanbacteria bacterium]